jgi:UDP-glucose:(heptosyl)LPS alpha-1,3-glucosyltransferase
LRVEWHGVVSDAERYLRISDVELNLSLHDSFNLSLAEAMSCGIPVVSTSIVGIADHIKSARAGFLVDVKTGRDGTLRPANAEAVAALRKLAASASLRDKMSARASVFANNHYVQSDQLIRMARRVGASRN